MSNDCCQLRLKVDYQLPTTNYQLPTINYQLILYPSHITDYA
ncbi:MAG: hypothetical protein ACRC62_29840 [Microcoleus sp.]